jgi:hypothetical protein
MDKSKTPPTYLGSCRLLTLCLGVLDLSIIQFPFFITKCPSLTIRNFFIAACWWATRCCAGVCRRGSRCPPSLRRTARCSTRRAQRRRLSRRCPCRLRTHRVRLSQCAEQGRENERARMRSGSNATAKPNPWAPSKHGFHSSQRRCSPVQANCRTHRPQKLECLISPCTNPVSILSVPIQTAR